MQFCRTWVAAAAVCPPRGQPRRDAAVVAPRTERPLLSAEGEVHPRYILEVGLPGRVTREVIGTKVGSQIINFHGTELDGTRDGNVEPAAELHCETVIVAA